MTLFDLLVISCLLTGHCTKNIHLYFTVYETNIQNQKNTKSTHHRPIARILNESDEVGVMVGDMLHHHKQTARAGLYLNSRLSLWWWWPGRWPSAARRGIRMNLSHLNSQQAQTFLSHWHALYLFLFSFFNESLAFFVVSNSNVFL